MTAAPAGHGEIVATKSGAACDNLNSLNSGLDVDSASPLTFIAGVNLGVPLSGIVSRASAFFRVFVALTVAIATSYHFCGVASARNMPSQVAIVAVADTTAAEQSDMSVEKCHFCSILLVAAVTVFDCSDVAHMVPAGRGGPLSSVSPTGTPPPPRS